jgi:hypothetical protein
MTGRIGSAVSTKTLQRLTAAAGVNASLATVARGGVALTPLIPAQIRAQNAAADLVERSTVTQYPCIQVYCEKIVNDLGEKFQTFSGSVHMAIEIRHSQDGLEGLEAAAELYTDAVMRTLDMNRGDWGDGMYYAGGYQVVFSAVKHGGRNFVQVEKVTFQIGAGIN